MAASREEIYERVKEVLTEQLGVEESEINETNDAICRGAKSLGYRWSVIARNSLGCDSLLWQ